MSFTGNASRSGATAHTRRVAGTVVTSAAAGLLVGALASTADRAPAAAIATGGTVMLLLLVVAIGAPSELSTGGFAVLSVASAGLAAAGLALARSEGTAVTPAAALSGWSAVALVLALRPGARRLQGVAIAGPSLALGVAALGAVAIWSGTAFEAVALLTIGAPLGLLLLVVAGDRWSVAVAFGAVAGALAATTELDRLTVLPGLVAVALGLTGFLVLVAAHQPAGVVDAELLTVATFVGVLGAGLWCGPASLSTAAVALVVVRRVPPASRRITAPAPRAPAQRTGPVVNEGDPWW